MGQAPPNMPRVAERQGQSRRSRLSLETHEGFLEEGQLI